MENVKEIKTGTLLKDPGRGVFYLVFGIFQGDDGKIWIKVTDGYYTWSIPADYPVQVVAKPETTTTHLLTEVNQGKIYTEDYRIETLKLFSRDEENKI